MLNKSDSGVYYLNEETRINADANNNFTKDKLKSILALRRNKEEAIDYYLQLLEVI